MMLAQAYVAHCFTPSWRLFNRGLSQIIPKPAEELGAYSVSITTERVCMRHYRRIGESTAPAFMVRTVIGTSP